MKNPPFVRWVFGVHSSKPAIENPKLPEKTLLKLKAIAARDGLPYQTLAASAIHRFVLRDGT